MILRFYIFPTWHCRVRSGRRHGGERLPLWPTRWGAEMYTQRRAETPSSPHRRPPPDDDGPAAFQASLDHQDATQVLAHAATLVRGRPSQIQPRLQDDRRNFGAALYL